MSARTMIASNGHNDQIVPKTIFHSSAGDVDWMVRIIWTTRSTST